MPGPGCRSSSTILSRCTATAEFHDASSAGSTQKFFLLRSVSNVRKAVGQHDQRHVVVPSAPTAALIVIQPEFLLELLIVLLDLPSALATCTNRRRL